MGKKYIPLLPCKHATNVNCPETGRRCNKCGWNPEVTAKRKEAIRRKLGGRHE